MKKKYLLLVVTLVMASLTFTGCGRNNAEENNPTSEVQNDFMDGNGVDAPLDNTGADLTLGDDTNGQNNTGMGQNTENTGTTSDTNTGTQESGSEEENTVTGIITEIKDFMFVIEDDAGMAYGFTFEGDMPKGLENVTEGDEVIVTYTGEVSEVDAFTGEVISVEKVDSTNR